MEIKSTTAPAFARSKRYPSGSTVVYSGGGSGGSGASAEQYFYKKTDANGTAYIITDYPIISSKSVISHASDAPYIPSVYEEIPLDPETLTWKDGFITVIGGGGEGGSSTPVTVKLGNTPYESVDGVVSLPAYPAMPDLSNLVTLNTEQRIRANKWFGDNFKIDSNSGSPVVVAYSGPWERGLEAQASTGSVLGEFGFFGDGDTLRYAYIGNNYGNPWLHITPTGRLSTMLNGENTSLRLLKDSNNPYGLIVSLMDTGTASLQARRDANASEVFSLQLQPEGGNIILGESTKGRYQETMIANCAQIIRADGGQPFLMFHYPNNYYWRLQADKDGLKTVTGDGNNVFTNLCYVNGEGRIGVNIGNTLPTQALDVGGTGRFRSVPDYAVSDRFAAFNPDGTLTSISKSNISHAINSGQTFIADLTGLDENTWYPLIVTVSTERMCKICVRNVLNTNVPSWSTHGAGFSCEIEMLVNGNGWGTIATTSILLKSDQGFYSGGAPFGGTYQVTNYSMQVLYLRGGGLYNLWSDTDANSWWNPRQGVNVGDAPYTQYIPTRSASQLTGVESFGISFAGNNIWAAGSISCASTSDERLKTFEEEKDFCKLLTSVGKARKFKYNEIEAERSGNKDDDTHYGLVYQDVIKSPLAHIAGTKQDGYGYVDYLNNDLKGVMIGAIQELIKDRDEMKKQIEYLTEIIREIRK